MVIFLIALVVLGPDKLPGAARQAGKYMSEFRRISQGFQQELRDAVKEVAPDLSSPAPMKPTNNAVILDPDAPVTTAATSTSSTSTSSTSSTAAGASAETPANMVPTTNPPSGTSSNGSNGSANGSSNGSNGSSSGSSSGSSNESSTDAVPPTFPSDPDAPTASTDVMESSTSITVDGPPGSFS